MNLELLKVVFFGIVEGITEWLPISSTGHLILLEQCLPLKASPLFKEMFQVVIQLGAILAVVVLYFHTLNPSSYKKTKEKQKDTIRLWQKIFVACIPAGVTGVLFDDWIEARLYNYMVVAMMLIIYGVLFLLVEIRSVDKRSFDMRLSDISYRTALGIGVFQALSLVPGTSRSGATIMGAMLLGVPRYRATEFTFFLAIPTMLGASALKLWKFFSEANVMSMEEIVMLGVGCLIAFFVSIFSMQFLMKYIKGKDFKGFGVYRIILGIFVLLYFLFQ